MLRTTFNPGTLARLIGCGMLAILLLFRIAHAQSAPTLTATWVRSSVLLTWSGLPYGACVELDGVLLSDTCSPVGSLTLAVQGVDTRYAVRGGSMLVVRNPIRPQDGPARVLASAVVPPFVVILPVVVAPDRQEIR